ncbi:MAG: TolC family protein [Candidatus Ancaeobacter aquaticus]|nr:TolC family protein [Candidatus Ancaeobacter aquaticus]
MNKNTIQVTLLITSLMIFSSSCTFLPKIKKPPEGKISEAFTESDSKVKMPDQWWTSFENNDLNALMGKAFVGNLSLKETFYRLKQAKARAVIAGSELFPQINATGNASRNRTMRENVTTNTTTWGTQHRKISTTIQDWAVGIAASYEVDLWGRIRSGRSAAIFEEMASEKDLETSAFSLSAEITDRWIRILEQRAQKRLLHEQLKTNKSYLELVELRYKKAIVSSLDVYQQKQTVESIRQQIPLVEAQEQVLLHELAVLLGKLPRTNMDITEKSLPHLPALPETGIPADLLQNRPDVKAAFLRLQESRWNVSGAIANRLPAINLTGAASYDTEGIEDLFDNWFFNLGSSLAMPLVDGFKRKAEVERTKAVMNEYLNAYRRTVLNAIKEVEDALIREKKQIEHIDSLKDQIDAARKGLEVAGERYLKGVSDYLPVLTQLSAVQRLERDMITSHRNLLVYRVNLYRALGGTWTDNIEQKLEHETETATAKNVRK